MITINCPLHPETEHLFNDALIGTMKRGAYLVNTARGKICDRDEYLIVHGGTLAGVGAHSYSAGNATGGSEEAGRFKT